MFKKRHLLLRSPNQSLPWSPRGLASNPPMWVNRFLGFCGKVSPWFHWVHWAPVLPLGCGGRENKNSSVAVRVWLLGVTSTWMRTSWKPWQQICLRSCQAIMWMFLSSTPSTTLTLGTACSGTDSPVFVLRAITGAIGARVKHQFSCEYDKGKQHWIKTACDIDKDFKLFGDIAEIGCEYATNIITGNSELVPTSTLFVAGFSCKSLSRSVAFVVVEYFFGTCSPHPIPSTGQAFKKLPDTWLTNTPHY